MDELTEARLRRLVDHPDLAALCTELSHFADVPVGNDLRRYWLFLLERAVEFIDAASRVRSGVPVEPEPSDHGAHGQ